MIPNLTDVYTRMNQDGTVSILGIPGCVIGPSDGGWRLAGGRERVARGGKGDSSNARQL